MNGDLYLRSILTREAVDTGWLSPVRAVQAHLMPTLSKWGNRYLQSVTVSGSFAKGTANKSGTDIDLFISLSPDTPDSLKEVHETLVAALRSDGYAPRLQNVSIGIKVGGYDVDLVPGKLQNGLTTDHSLFRRKANTWTKTNVNTHIRYVIAAGCVDESRVVKLWRNQKGIDFPSSYLELVVIAALKNSNFGSLADRVWKVFSYLNELFVSARFIDIANTNNVISDDLGAIEKVRIKNAAAQALSATTWNEIVR